MKNLLATVSVQFSGVSLSLHLDVSPEELDTFLGPSALDGTAAELQGSIQVLLSEMSRELSRGISKLPSKIQRQRTLDLLKDVKKKKRSLKKLKKKLSTKEPA